MSRPLLVALATAGSLSWAAPAAAQPAPAPVTKKMWFAEKAGRLVASVSFTELFDAAAYRRLADGTVTTVALRAYVFAADAELPLSVSMATFRVVYDLWDETYLVRIANARGERNWTFKSRADAIRAVTEVAGIPLAPLGRIAIGPRYRAEIVVQLNPVSSEQLAEMRRWLTRRAGSAQLDTDSSFFGSFVSVFVNPQLQGADAVLRLRSQPFYRVAK